MFVTVIVNVAVPPDTTVWVSGVFSMSIAGWITSTAAVSLSVTGPPSGGVPATLATLVRSAVMTARVQV